MSQFDNLSQLSSAVAECTGISMQNISGFLNDMRVDFGCQYAVVSGGEEAMKKYSHLDQDDIDTGRLSSAWKKFVTLGMFSDDESENALMMQEARVVAETKYGISPEKMDDIFAVMARFGVVVVPETVDLEKRAQHFALAIHKDDDFLKRNFFFKAVEEVKQTGASVLKSLPRLQ